MEKRAIAADVCLIYSKNQIFGQSQATDNLISLVMIFGLAIIIMLIGGANILSGGVALGVVFMGSIFFTIVGMLSPFFLVGIFLVGLIVVILGFVMSSGG